MHAHDPIAALAAVRHEFGEHGGVNMSVETSTTFTVLDPHTMPEIFAGARGPDAGGCYLYGRHINPTVYALGRELAAIEGTEAGYCTASGMAAISATLMQLCNHGDEVVAASTVYGGTYALLAEFLPRKAGVSTRFVDVSDLAAVEAAFTPRTRVLYVETMSNPTLSVADIPRLAAIAHARGAQLVVDNTFAPLLVTPARLGADVVVHSLTKFINGASDAIGGVICCSKAFLGELIDLHTGALMLQGPTMDARIAFLVSLRLPHLGLRMAEHGRRAQLFAERLSERGLHVVYPGLPGHPHHALARQLMNPDYGFGGLLTLDVGSAARAMEVMRALQDRHFGFVAVSLGYHHTLMSASAASTSSEMPEDMRDQVGIHPGLIRLSVGYSGTTEQRWNQLEDGLRAVGVLS